MVRIRGAGCVDAGTGGKLSSSVIVGACEGRLACTQTNLGPGFPNGSTDDGVNAVHGFKSPESSAAMNVLRAAKP